MQMHHLYLRQVLVVDDVHRRAGQERSHVAGRHLHEPLPGSQ